MKDAVFYLDLLYPTTPLPCNAQHLHPQTAFKDAFTAVFGDRGARSRPSPHHSVTVETGFPYPTVVANPASPRQQAREAIRAGVRGLRGRGAALARSDHPDESGVRDKGGVHTGPEVNYHEWDNYVPYGQVPV